MRHIDTRSLAGYSHYPKGGAMRVSILVFQRNQFLQSFPHQTNTLSLTHTHNNVMKVISKCLKQAALGYNDEHFIWRFLQITLLGVIDFTLS